MSEPPSLVINMTAWPPSTNKLWSRAPGGKRVRSKEYRQWLLHTGWEVKRQIVGQEPIACRFDVLIEVPISRRDTGNWEKALMDLCEHVGVVTNDGNAREIRIRPITRDDCMLAFWLLPDLDGVRKKRKASIRVSGFESKATIRTAPKSVARRWAAAGLKF